MFLTFFFKYAFLCLIRVVPDTCFAVKAMNFTHVGVSKVVAAKYQQNTKTKQTTKRTKNCIVQKKTKKSKKNRTTLP